MYEALHSEVFSKDDYLHTVEELYEKWPSFKEIINHNYKSFFNKKDLVFPEISYNEIYSRISIFIDSIKFKNKNKLIVSHMSPIITIRDYVLFNKIPDVEYHYPMGYLEKII